MKPEKEVAVKWNERRLLLPSALIGVVFLALLLATGERAKPPEGHVFERMAPISGVYHCCGGGGRTSWSSVAGIYANCSGLAFFPFTGVSWYDCGYKEQLNGKVVEIQRTTVPTLLPSDAIPVVTKLSSGGKTYIEYSDKTLRTRWISQMQNGASTIALVMSLVSYFLLFVYYDRQSKAQQEE